MRFMSPSHFTANKLFTFFSGGDIRQRRASRVTIHAFVADGLASRRICGLDRMPCSPMLTPIFLLFAYDFDGGRPSLFQDAR